METIFVFYLYYVLQKKIVINLFLYVCWVFTDCSEVVKGKIKSQVIPSMLVYILLPYHSHMGRLVKCKDNYM